MRTGRSCFQIYGPLHFEQNFAICSTKPDLQKHLVHSIEAPNVRMLLLVLMALVLLWTSQLGTETFHAPCQMTFLMLSSSTVKITTFATKYAEISRGMLTQALCKAPLSPRKENHICCELLSCAHVPHRGVSFLITKTTFQNTRANENTRHL